MCAINRERQFPPIGIGYDMTYALAVGKKAVNLYVRT